MVVAAPMLVVRDDQQGLAPRRPGAQGPVGIEDELFAGGHAVVGVLAVAGGAPGRLHERERGEGSGRGVRCWN